MVEQSAIRPDQSENRLVPSDRLSEHYLDAIADRYGGGFREITFRPGINLIHQGDRGIHDDSLFVILNGTVAIVKQDVDTEREVARLGGAGALVGEIRALNPVIPRTRTVRAVGEVTAIRILGSDVAKWNGAARPWGEIHALLTDLARSRLTTMDPRELKELGFDARSQLSKLTLEVEQSSSLPDQHLPVSLLEERIRRVRAKREEFMSQKSQTS